MSDELYDRLKISEAKLYEQEKINSNLLLECDLANCRAERAEAMVERLIEAGAGMYDRICALYEDRHIGDMPKGHDDWEVLVAEWQAVGYIH